MAEEIVYTARISKLGRQMYINVPKYVRESYGLSPGDIVEVRLRILKKSEETKVAPTPAPAK